MKEKGAMVEPWKVSGKWTELHGRSSYVAYVFMSHPIYKMI